MTVIDRQITADEFMWLEDEDGLYMELERGRVVRIVVGGFQHGAITTRLVTELNEHVKARGLGVVLGRASFKLESDLDTVRQPDFTFISQKRVPKELTDSYFDGPPDLAGEVLCPTDPPSLVEQKTREYMETGVRMLWIVDSREKSIAVYRPGADAVTLREGDVLDGGDVVPGFVCNVGHIFRDWRDD